MIQRGYDRRHRNLWSATRWQTYNLMCAFAGSEALSKAGINSAKDLLPLPWDNDHSDFDEVSDVVAEINAINAHRLSSVSPSVPVPAGSSAGQSESSEP